MAIPEEDLPTPGHEAGRRRAAGIYGTIVTAAVIAAGGDELSTLALEGTVLLTLVVYWVAEEYAELLGEQTHAGRLPSLSRVRSSLGASWPMVTSSFVPLITLVLARLLGATAPDAAEWALIVTIVLLVFHGYRAGRAARLTSIRLAAVTFAAACLGGMMVLLKALLQNGHY